MGTGKWYIYLLVEEKTDNCKVGISIDSYKRSKVIPQNINYDKSITCSYQNSKIVHLEKLLHSILEPYRIHTMKGDGHTEWFSPEAFDIAKSLITSMKESMKLSDWQKVSSLQQVKEPKPTVRKKKTKKPKKPTEDKKDCVKFNIKEYERFSSILIDLCNKGATFSTGDNYVECTVPSVGYDLEYFNDLFCSIQCGYSGINILTYLTYQKGELYFTFQSIHRLEEFAKKNNINIDYYKELYKKYVV